MTDDEVRRERIRNKISASQDTLRSAPSQAATPAEKLSGLVHEYPGLVIAGGLALGLLAGSLLPRSAGRKLSTRAAALAAVASEVGLALGKQAIERAGEAGRDGRELLGEFSHTVSDKASDARRAAGEASSRVRHTGVALAKKAVEIAGNGRW